MEKLNIIFLILSVICILLVVISKYFNIKINLPFLDNILKHEKIIVATLLLIAIILRFIKLGVLPIGLNQDEASMGYDAYSILNFGIDRNAYKFPIYLFAWGSGQNALYSYLAIPFIKILGLNIFSIRLVQPIFACISLFLIYLMLKKYNNKIALLTLFLLTISPWHIMLSRWSLESNLFPAFMIISIHFLIKSIDNNKLLYIALPLFGITLYSYALSYLVIPIFLLLTISYMLIMKKATIKKLIIPSILFLIIATPLLLMVLQNANIISSVNLPMISIPTFSGYRGNEISISNIGANFINIIKIVFTGNDNLIHNVIPKYGIFYLFSIPFLIIGFIHGIFDIIKKFKNNIFDHSLFIYFWFVGALIVVLLVHVNITRSNCLYVPLIYFIALGIFFVIKHIKFLSIIIIPMYLVAFISFTNYYFTKYNDDINLSFNESFDEALIFTNDLNYKNLYITNDINMPYIHVLFHKKDNPIDYLNTVNFIDKNSSFQVVKSYNNYIFEIDLNNLDKESVYVFPNQDKHYFIAADFNVKTFKLYSVAY